MMDRNYHSEVKQGCESSPSHIPRGFMCIGCEHVHRKCNHLDFTKMQVIGVFKDDGTKEVKCTDHTEINKGE